MNNGQGGFMGRDEESENIGGGRIRGYIRHTTYQTQQLENFYENYPYPDANQISELGRRRNLEPRQIRFWCQNRRARLRTQEEHRENIALRQERERLLRDQERFKQAMILRNENFRLKRKIDQIQNFLSRPIRFPQAVYDESHIHQFYQNLIGLEIGVGAKRLLTTLQRHCEIISTFSPMNLTEVFSGLPAKGATEIVKLAHRMTLNYYSGITVSSVGTWERIQVENEGEDMNFIIQKNEIGIVLSGATSVRLPVNQQLLFDFLSNKSFRSEWDILTYNTSMEDLVHIQKAERHGNYVSVFRIVGNGVLVLQEVWNDASGALVVYAPVETNPMEKVMKGENSDFVQLLHSGFSILPDVEAGGGCLLTLGTQILVSSKPNVDVTPSFVKMVEELMVKTIGKIKFAFGIQT